jgi:hypothetical protein
VAAPNPVIRALLGLQADPPPAQQIRVWRDPPLPLLPISSSAPPKPWKLTSAACTSERARSAVGIPKPKVSSGLPNRTRRPLPRKRNPNPPNCSANRKKRNFRTAFYGGSAIAHRAATPSRNRSLRPTKRTCRRNLPAG